MQHVRSSIKALAAAAFVAVGLLLPLSTGAHASTPAATYRVGVICYIGDPQIVVVGVGNYPAGQPTRILCEAGDSGAGASLRYQINGPGTGWIVTHADGATLVLNTMGTKIHMPARYIDHHIYCPKLSFLQAYAITCTKATWGYPGERATDGL